MGLGTATTIQTYSEFLSRNINYNYRVDSNLLISPDTNYNICNLLNNDDISELTLGLGNSNLNIQNSVITEYSKAYLDTKYISNVDYINTVLKKPFKGEYVRFITQGDNKGTLNTDSGSLPLPKIIRDKPNKMEGLQVLIGDNSSIIITAGSCEIAGDYIEFPNDWTINKNTDIYHTRFHNNITIDVNSDMSNLDIYAICIHPVYSELDATESNRNFLNPNNKYVTSFIHITEILEMMYQHDINNKQYLDYCLILGISHNLTELTPDYTITFSEQNPPTPIELTDPNNPDNTKTFGYISLNSLPLSGTYFIKVYAPDYVLFEEVHFMWSSQGNPALENAMLRCYLDRDNKIIYFSPSLNELFFIYSQIYGEDATFRIEIYYASTESESKNIRYSDGYIINSKIYLYNRNNFSYPYFEKDDITELDSGIVTCD